MPVKKCLNCKLNTICRVYQETINLSGFISSVHGKYRQDIVDKIQYMIAKDCILFQPISTDEKNDKTP